LMLQPMVNEFGMCKNNVVMLRLKDQTICSRIDQ
jgi:hypothetical protein